MVAADGLGAGPTWAKDRGTDWAAMGGDGLLVDGSVQVEIPFFLFVETLIDWQNPPGDWQTPSGDWQNPSGDWK